jgi:hypothetical protein
MAEETFDALDPPPMALKEGGKEVLRAVIVNGGLHVSIVRAFETPDVWGLLIADIARHAARIFARESAMRESEALAEIVGMFEMEMEKPTDPGTTDAIQ